MTTGAGARDAAELAEELYNAWGAIRDASRRAGQLPSLSPSQVAVLRRLVARGPARPATLADDLGLARPTISNLLRDLEDEALVERLASRSDGRSVLVVITERARKVLETFARERVRLVVQEYNRLEPADRAALAAAVGPLRQLISGLNDRVGA